MTSVFSNLKYYAIACTEDVNIDDVKEMILVHSDLHVNKVFGLFVKREEDEYYTITNCDESEELQKKVGDNIWNALEKSYIEENGDDELFLDEINIFIILDVVDSYTSLFMVFQEMCKLEEWKMNSANSLWDLFKTDDNEIMIVPL